MNVYGYTMRLLLILSPFITLEISANRDVAVKFLDITKNSDCEASLLDCH